MSGFDGFVSGAKKAINKAALKVNDLADCASDSIKIEGLKLKLSEKYEELGKIVYNEMATGTFTENSAAKAAEIEALLKQIDALKAKKAERKAKSEEAEEAEETVTEEAETEPSEEEKIDEE